MRKTLPICALALTLAACGGKDKPADDRSNAVEYVNVVDEMVPAEGTGGNAAAPTAGDTTLPSAGTSAQQALADANKAVPFDKRRQLWALLECEEGKLAAPVAPADRPEFMRRTLAQLDADPNAVANCRASGQQAQPTQ